MFDDGFEEFWMDYPRRDAKKDARKAWHQIKPSPAMRTAIHEALAWQKQSEQWQKSRTLIPLPATYLRGERWTDERPIPKRSAIVEPRQYCGQNGCVNGWVERESGVVPCGCRHRRGDLIVVSVNDTEPHGTTEVAYKPEKFDRAKMSADLRQNIINFRKRANG